ncbi:hypothetical protein CLAIMM_10176 [Cladophialophora immunda]|nr:hypothetical protein CLAIMM_10176 [Cladophialophora immunda]
MTSSGESNHHQRTSDRDIPPEASQHTARQQSPMDNYDDDVESLYTLREMLSIQDQPTCNGTACPFRGSVNTSTETVMSEPPPVGVLKVSRLSRCWRGIKRRLPRRQRKMSTDGVKGVSLNL